MDALQHCRTMVALRCVELTLLCWFSSLLQALLTFTVLGFGLHLHCLLDRGGKDGLSDLVLMAFDAPAFGFSVDSPDNSLIESTSLIESLFQHRVRNLGSHRFLCTL